MSLIEVAAGGIEALQRENQILRITLGASLVCLVGWFLLALYWRKRWMKLEARFPSVSSTNYRPRG